MERIASPRWTELRSAGFSWSLKSTFCSEIPTRSWAGCRQQRVTVTGLTPAALRVRPCVAVVDKLADTADELTIEVAGSDKPAVLRQPGFVYLVLPMKVS